MHRDRTEAAGRKTIVMTLVDREGDAVGVVIPDCVFRSIVITDSGGR